MVDAKLGTKRVCDACDAKFYDLNKSPVTCPKCGHSFDPSEIIATPKPAARIAPKVEAEKPDEGELEDDEDALSLDDIDEAKDDDDDEDDEALAEFSDDGTLLEEDDDDDDDDDFISDEDDD